MKKLIAWILTLTFLLAAGGCTTESPVQESPSNAAQPVAQPAGSAMESTNSPGGTGDTIRMASLFISAQVPSNTNMVAAMQARAEGMGAEFSAYYYEANVSRMIETIENLTSSGIDVLFLQPQGSQDGVEQLKKAKESGMRILLFDTELPDVDYDYWFTADNFELGRIIGTSAGNWANENIPEDIDVIVGMLNEPIAESIIQREAGIRAGLEESCPRSEVVIEASSHETVTGLEAGENFLQAYPNMNVVVGINDSGVFGVYEAFRAAGVTHDVGMFSTDAMQQVLEAIKEDGMYRVTVDLELNSVGETMVDFAMDAIQGTEVAGRERVNYFPMTAVSVDNISDYLS